MEFYNTDTKRVTFEHVRKRLEKPTSKATNERAALIEPFVERLNQSRTLSGYKPYSPGYIASKMSHIATDELDYFYKKLDAAKNFSSLWHYYCVPKKK